MYSRFLAVIAVLISTATAQAQTPQDIVDAANAGEGARALEIAEALAAEGDSLAMNYAGIILERGVGDVAQDLEAAYQWYLRGAEAGRVVGYSFAARVRLQQMNAPGDLTRQERRAMRREAFELLERGIEAGDPKAGVDLAREYLIGRNIAADPERAAAILEEEYAKGSPFAGLDYAVMLLEGEFFERDVERALEAAESVPNTVPQYRQASLLAADIRSYLNRGSDVSFPHPIFRRQIYIEGRKTASRLEQCVAVDFSARPRFNKVGDNRVEISSGDYFRRAGNVDSPSVGVLGHVVFGFDVSSSPPALVSVDANSLRRRVPDGGGEQIEAMPEGALRVEFDLLDRRFPLSAEDTRNIFYMEDGSGATHMRLDADLCATRDCADAMRNALAAVEDALADLDESDDPVSISFMTLTPSDRREIFVAFPFHDGLAPLRETAAHAMTLEDRRGRIERCEEVERHIERAKTYRTLP